VTGTPRSALVTGASKGIGRSIASRLAASGYAVTGTYRSGGVPDGVLGVSADITDPEQLEQAFVAAEQAHGPVEVLVCNAGITADGLLMRMSDEQWDSVIATNLTASFKLVRRASRSMIKGRFGRIVFVSSVVALLGSAGQVNYAASKAGLVGLARSLTRELGARPGDDRGVREAHPGGPSRGHGRRCLGGGVPGLRRRRLHLRSRAARRRRPWHGPLGGTSWAFSKASACSSPA
jgi:NAD(P)-dependent dehydrogenase (short-subunit alcohol dehydrogenase family)